MNEHQAEIRAIHGAQWSGLIKTWETGGSFAELLRYYERNGWKIERVEPGVVRVTTKDDWQFLVRSPDTFESAVVAARYEKETA